MDTNQTIEEISRRRFWALRPWALPPAELGMIGSPRCALRPYVKRSAAQGEFQQRVHLLCHDLPGLIHNDDGVRLQTAFGQKGADRLDILESRPFPSSYLLALRRDDMHGSACLLQCFLYFP